MMRAAVLLLAIVLGACGGEPQPPLVATNVVITQPMPGSGMSAAYLSLTNNTDDAISISRVTSAQYQSAELHESTIEDGVARMRAIAEFQIPAGETLRFQRGAKHVMLMRPTGPFTTVSLQFFDGDVLLLEVDSEIESKTD